MIFLIKIKIKVQFLNFATISYSYLSFESSLAKHFTLHHVLTLSTLYLAEWKPAAWTQVAQRTGSTTSQALRDGFGVRSRTNRLILIMKIIQKSVVNFH